MALITTLTNRFSPIEQFSAATATEKPMVNKGAGDSLIVTGSSAAEQKHDLNCQISGRCRCLPPLPSERTGEDRGAAPQLQCVGGWVLLGASYRRQLQFKFLRFNPATAVCSF